MSVPDVVPPPVPTVPPPAAPPAPPPAAPPAGEFKVPEQYAKEPWATNVKSVEDLFSQMANAQILLGRKGVIVPTEKSTPEEIKNFRATLGVPETPEGYEFKTVEALKALPRDAKIDGVVKEALFKNGVPKAVGEAVIYQLEQMVYDQSKPKLEAMTKAEKDFSALKFATFGEEAEVAMGKFQEVISATLGDAGKHLIAKLNEIPSEAKMITIAFAKAIHDKYVGEFKINPPNPGGSGGNSPDVQSAYRELSEAKIVVKNDKTMPQHIKDQRLQELNKKMQEVGKKANAAGINLFA